MFFHGGAYVHGTAHDYRWFCGHLANAIGCSVLVIDYRLACREPLFGADRRCSDILSLACEPRVRWQPDCTVPVTLSSGTGLSKNMPKDAAEAFKNNFEATFSALLERAVSARSKRGRPEILEVMRARFMVQSNLPKYVFDSDTADPNGVFSWNIESRLREICKPIVLAGAEDQATPAGSGNPVTVAASKLVADNIPGAKASVIKEVGHFYKLEKIG